MKAYARLLLCFIVVFGSVVTVNVSKPEGAALFKDIPADHRAYKEIVYLAQGKITGGNNGYFKPKQNVTRAEFTAMLGRALDLDGTKQKTKFKDVGINNFASGYIQSAVNKKIISGYKDGSFKPNGLVTRGEMTIMISRAFGYHFNNSASGAATAILSRGIDTLAANGTFAAERKAIREETAIYIARAMDYSLRLNPVVSFNSERYVKDSSLNVRKGPSTAYAVLGTVNTNEKVQIGYQVGDWTLVKTSKNIIGFVSTYYLSVNELSASDDNLNKKNHPLASQTLVIDPGHGGTDAGAIGFGLKEKDVTLDTALRLKKLLAQTPLNVKYTREKDVTLNLVKDRVPYALSVKGDMFVSIHANAGGGTGSETYYYGKTATNPYVADSKLLAQYIQKRLIVAMETKNRGFKHGNFHVIRENRMPAVLVELAFIDTKTDNTKLKSPVYREKAAKAIYLGILDYYKAKGFNVAEYYKAI